VTARGARGMMTRRPARAGGACLRGCRIAASAVAPALRRGGLSADAAPGLCRGAPGHRRRPRPGRTARVAGTCAGRIRGPSPVPPRRNLPPHGGNPSAPSPRSPPARAVAGGPGPPRPATARRRGSVGSACTRSCGLPPPLLRGAAITIARRMLLRTTTRDATPIDALGGARDAWWRAGPTGTAAADPGSGGGASAAAAVRHHAAPEASACHGGSLPGAGCTRGWCWCRAAHCATPRAALPATVRRGPGDGIMPPAATAGLRPVEP
jgi:hypothetical protein